MALLEEVGDGGTIATPLGALDGCTWEAEETEEAIIVGTVGPLLERARAALG